MTIKEMIKHARVQAGDNEQAAEAAAVAREAAAQPIYTAEFAKYKTGTSFYGATSDVQAYVNALKAVAVWAKS